jgi:membrane protein YqaA with SNARE-associated domain
MFDIVKAIHEALHIQSTWAFVTVIALGSAVLGGGTAWIVDHGYKNSLLREGNGTTTVIEQKAKDSNCSNIQAGKNVTVDCSSKEMKNDQIQKAHNR